MKLKKICSICAMSILLTQSTVFADDSIKEMIYTNKNDVKQEIKIDKTKYKLQSMKEGKEILETKNTNVKEQKIITVNNLDINNIKNEYSNINYDKKEGKGTLNLKNIDVKENYKENYWETLSFQEKITNGYVNYSSLPSNLKSYTDKGLNYKLIQADFIPIGYNSDNTPIFKNNLKYGAIVPHYSKEISNYTVTLDYEGTVKKEVKKGNETIAIYEKVNTYTKEIVSAIAGTFLVVAGFMLRKNVFIYADNKKVKGYRKSRKGITIDISKEVNLFENIEVVISKRLSKKLDNTNIEIVNNGIVLYKNILNNSSEEIRIKIK